MGTYVRLLMVAVVSLSVLFGCSKASKPMPLTKENVVTYMQKMGTAAKNSTPKDIEEAQGNTGKQKDLYYTSFVEPLEKMGYSYDKTIGAIASQLLAKTLRTPDTETTVMLSDLLAFAKNSRGIAFRFGFISKETKELLDQVSLIFPR
ncbi:MAG TPA: hypothetical protein VL949_04365 [Geobacteraceae bacterium]|nr:hypothetical protein [Geobacteraceae bacterium]